MFSLQKPRGERTCSRTLETTIDRIVPAPILLVVIHNIECCRVFNRCRALSLAMAEFSIPVTSHPSTSAEARKSPPPQPISKQSTFVQAAKAVDFPQISFAAAWLTSSNPSLPFTA